jgi:membrane protein involved in colicin uptake
LIDEPINSQSLKDLRAILHCDNREIQKLGRRMLDAVITGSPMIWQQYARMIGRGSTSEREEQALINQERMEMLKTEESKRDEDIERVKRIEGVSEEEQHRNGRRRDEESDGRE